MNEFYCRRTHTAKKQHTCNCCWDTIPVGEKYHYISGKYDGVFFVQKIHIECHDLFDALYDKLDYIADVGFDHMIDMLYEYFYQEKDQYIFCIENKRERFRQALCRIEFDEL